MRLHFLPKKVWLPGFTLYSNPVLFLWVILLIAGTLPAAATPPERPQKDGLKFMVVSGTVSDEAGNPLPGVSVTEKGTANGVVTDSAGEFRISVQNGQAVLVFSFVGFQRQEVPLAGRSTVSVILNRNTGNLSEVVVVGYGTQQKRDVTGSVASVSGKEISSLPVTNTGEALQGRASGVQIINSGAPGSNVTIRIRGIGTINNSNPLLVIDGVPTDVPLNMINPDDVASIDILKDASATAIYGSRGANSVVLITTKKGTAGQSHLMIKAFTAIQSAAHIPDMLNAAQFAELHNEMMVNNGQPQNPAYANPASLGAGTNWLDELFRTAPMNSVTLSYSGGNDKSTYYVSGGVLDQKGIVINTGYRRYTVQFNSESKVFNWLKFGHNLTLNYDIKKSGDYSIRNAMAALPVQPVFNPDGTYSGPVGKAMWYGDITNPIGMATLNSNTTKGYNILGNIYGEINLLNNLKFKTTGGVQAMFWDSRNWRPKYNWIPIAQPFSTLSQQYNKSLTWLWDNYFTYDKRFGEHHLTVLAGSSAQNNRMDYMQGSIQDFASSGAQQLNNGTSLPAVGGSASEWALLSFIGRANYDYGGKYLLTATVRRDGSSRFGEKNRWGTFPSASAAWRISEEDFFKKGTINELKLRAGYGITGNQNIGNYSYASVLQTVLYNFNNTLVNAVVPLSIPNPGVKWEQVEQVNLGLDISLWNSRVILTVDAYHKNTNDMLVPMAVPISTGYSDIVVPSINAGKVQNRGVELSVNTVNTKGAFEWNTNFNISFNKNKIISLNSDVPMHTGSIGLNQFLTIQQNGYPINSFYGFVMDGIFQSQQEVDKSATQLPGADPYNRTSAGDIKFKDLNNDGVINDDDRTIIGNPNPSFFYAMNNSFAFKGLDLTVFLQGVSGNDIFNANRIYQEGMAVAQNQTTAVLNRWTGSGTSNTMPRAVFNDPNKNTRVSSRFVEDGSYLKVKNITLGYTLPKSITQRVKLAAARIYLSGQNLFTITHYTGFDPEVPANGIDLSVYPVTRTLSAGINLTF